MRDPITKRPIQEYKGPQFEEITKKAMERAYNVLEEGPKRLRLPHY